MRHAIVNRGSKIPMYRGQLLDRQLTDNSLRSRCVIATTTVLAGVAAGALLGVVTLGPVSGCKGPHFWQSPVEVGPAIQQWACTTDRECELAEEAGRVEACAVFGDVDCEQQEVHA